MGALQLNDPDPLYWVTVYAMTALIPHSRLVQPHYASLFWITAGMVFAGLLQSSSGFIDFMAAGDWGLLTAPMTDKLPAIEYAREFLGLLFASLAWLVIGSRVLAINSPHRTVWRNSYDLRFRLVCAGFSTDLQSWRIGLTSLPLHQIFGRDKHAGNLAMVWPR